MKRHGALLLALLAACCQGARADTQGARTDMDCPAAAQVAQRHLLGLWRAEFEGLPRGATVLMEKHPEDEGRVSGMINRNGERSLLAGDLDKGEFAMEESADGTHISGVWTGDIAEGSCGRVIRGTWQEEKDPPRPYPFVLRKL